MSQGTGKELEARTQALVKEPELVATPITQRLQKVGQSIVTSPQVLEVQKDVFSTCPEPIDKLADRVLRARDAGIPLVEVTLLPADPVYIPLSRLFGIDGGPVYNIFRTDAQEENDGPRGNCIRYQRIGLISGQPGGIGILAVGGNWGSKIESHLDTGDYHGYDDSGKHMWANQRPSFSATISYEHSSGFGPDNRDGMWATLDLIEEEFGIATRREGSIEGTAIEIVEILPERQLPGYYPQLAAAHL